MYDHLSRPEDRRKLADPLARQRAVDDHTGSRHDFLRRHVKEAKTDIAAGGEAAALMLSRLRDRIADDRTLRIAWDLLRTQGGPSPGPDGITYSDLEEVVVWGLIRGLGRRIRAGEYRTGPTRKVDMPKPNGPGERRLELANVLERMVAKGADLVLQPVLDSGFADTSYGFRPGRDRNQALAHAEQLARGEDRWTWVTADIEKAFDAVPRVRLLQALEKKIPRTETVDLIGYILGGEGKRGIPSGNPLSPLMLNVYLDHFLDRTWKQQNPAIPLIRYADDILIMCRDGAEAHRALTDLTQMTRVIGMPLSARKTCAATLESCPLEWLGYSLTQCNGELVTHISENGWESLTRSLEETHARPGTPYLARSVLEGWISQQGPAYDLLEVRPTLDRLADLLKTLYLEEALDRTRLRRRWKEGHRQWLEVRGSRTLANSRPRS